MPQLITEEKFIEALENNEENRTSKELAATLGISLSYFYDLRKKHQNKIRDVAKEMCQRIAAEQVQNLQRNSKNGDTAAAVKILEIAGTYIPASKREIDFNAENCGVIVVPPKKPEGAPL